MSFEELCQVKSQTWMDWVSYISTWTLSEMLLYCSFQTHTFVLAWSLFCLLPDSLNIANNHFDGEFPEEWTSMTSLQKLDMSNNQLKGHIPILIDGMVCFVNNSVVYLAHYSFVSTSHNILFLNSFQYRKTFDYWTWHIISSQAPFLHSWEGKLQKLVSRCYSILATRHVQSNITLSFLSLSSLYKLEHLYLDDNEFDAELPKELGELTNLKKLTLHNNYLVGSVDDKICKLANELFLTQLSADCGGEIPEIYCDCCICKDHEPSTFRWAMNDNIRIINTSIQY